MPPLVFRLTREDWRAYLAYLGPRWWEISLRSSLVVAIVTGIAASLLETITGIEVRPAVFVAVLLALAILFPVTSSSATPDASAAIRNQNGAVIARRNPLIPTCAECSRDRAERPNQVSQGRHPRLRRAQG